jgi:hypothetical protein
VTRSTLRGRSWSLALLVGAALTATLAPTASATARTSVSAHRPIAVAPSATTTATTNVLTFSFSSGWTTAQKTPIQSFLVKAYPLMVGLYGPPSHSNAVVLTADTSLHGWAFTDPPSPWPDPNGTIHIRVNPADLGTWALRLRTLTHEILHACHGFDFMPTSAFEEGETESAAAILRPKIAAALSLGSAYAIPGEPEGDITYDGLNRNNLGGRYWFGPTSYWPHQQELYAAASASIWTLQIGKPSFYRDFNAAWYAHFDVTELWTAQVTWIHAKLAALAPTIGPWSYSTWRSKQYTFTTSHAAGYSLSCLDRTALAYSSADGPYHLSGEIVVDRAPTAGDDQQYTGTVHVVVYRPNGTVFVNTKLNAYYLLSWLYSATYTYPTKLAAGAYRVVVNRVTSTGDVRIGACRFVEGFSSQGRLIVIGIPGHKVTARYSYLNPTTHVVSIATASRTVGTNQLAIFGNATSGAAAIAPYGDPWLKVVPVGPRGAVASVTYP